MNWIIQTAIKQQGRYAPFLITHNFKYLRTIKSKMFSNTKYREYACINCGEKIFIDFNINISRRRVKYNTMSFLQNYDNNYLTCNQIIMHKACE